MITVNHDPQYILWVQFSLNRLVSAWIKTDGRVSDYYRTSVKAFQTITGANMPDGRVDKDCQDRLVAINNVDKNFASRAYIKWAQTALAQTTGFNGIPSGIMTKETKEAIKKFQISANHKHVDGVIGPKTERDLRNRVPDLKVPGWYLGGNKEPEPQNPDIEDWNRIKNDWFSLDVQLRAWTDRLIREYEENGSVFIEPVKNETIRKMLPKLQQRQIWGYSPNYKYDYLPADKVVKHDISQQLSSITHNGLHDLRDEAQRYTAGFGAEWRYQQFKFSIEDLFLRIWYGKEKIFHLKTHASGAKVGVYKVLEDWYDKVYSDKSTLLSCFPPQPEGSSWHPF